MVEKNEVDIEKDECLPLLLFHFKWATEYLFPIFQVAATRTCYQSHVFSSFLVSLNFAFVSCYESRVMLYFLVMDVCLGENYF